MDCARRSRLAIDWRRRPGASVAFQAAFASAANNHPTAANNHPTAGPSTLSAATERQRLLLAVLGGQEDLLGSLRTAWASDGWRPPRNELVGWFYWNLSKQQLGEHNPRWRAAAFAAAPSPKTRVDASIPRFDLPSGAAPIPPAAHALLEERECFVVRNHALWPAACARWGDPEYLRSELAGVPMSVLGNTARATDFHYFREGTEGVDSSGLFCAPKLKLSEWTPPPVSAVFMSIDDFLRHRGVEETEPTELVEPADDATAKESRAMCGTGHHRNITQTCL